MRMGKTSWFGEPSGSILKLVLLSFIIYAQVVASQLYGITVKSFHFTLCPILAVTSFTCSSRAMPARRDFLQQYNIKIIPWPAVSPDLHPIEHLWNEIHRKLNEVRPRPMTVADVSVAFLRIWAAIPIAFNNRLIHPMYRRCVSVVNIMGDTRGIDS